MKESLPYPSERPLIAIPICPENRESIPTRRELMTMNRQTSYYFWRCCLTAAQDISYTAFAALTLITYRKANPTTHTIDELIP